MRQYKKGDFIGQKYEVYGVLGEGGFGIVYLVYYDEIKGIYALKTFRDEYLEDVTTRERFKKEAQVWIDLERHPYLVRAHFVDEISGRLFIAMEFIASEEHGLNSLDAYLKRRPPDLAQSLKWAIQFCYGMEYAYSRGIKAHRDIKPANIMIGQDKAVKISDFGLAGVIGESKAISGIKLGIQNGNIGFSCQTMEGVGFGTPTHMPPEQFINAAGCDERSDIYSFGVVLYQMASGGKLPFLTPLPRNDEYEESRRFWIEMHNLHRQAPIPKINTPLSPIIFRCLEKNPINRYFSFEELCRDLETMLKKQTNEVINMPEIKELEAWELVNKGVSLSNLGKCQEAIACYDRALEINPGDAETWYNKGNVFKKLGKPQDEMACYDKALEINPRCAAVWINKGIALADRLGKPQDEIACYDKALEINPRYAAAWINKGILLADRLGKPQEAIACFNRSLEIYPKYAAAWNNKGIVLGRLGKYQEAIACYDKALEINPTFAEAWYWKGIALGGLGKYQEAIVCYDKALAIDNRDAWAWSSRGVTLGTIGKYQEAIACYDKAIEINPKYAAAWNNKGIALGSLGKYQEAIACYDRALEINPEYAGAWDNKAFAEDKLGRGQGAVFSYKRFIEYVRKRLRELGGR